MAELERPLSRQFQDHLFLPAAHWADSSLAPRDQSRTLKLGCWGRADRIAQMSAWCFFFFFKSMHTLAGASRVAQMEKNLPAVQETRVPTLGQKDRLEKEMATHFSILAWRTP